MSQLKTLLQTLSGQEHSMLSSLRLIGKEKEVFNFITGLNDAELPEMTAILKQLNITDTHYYKVNSVLLRKCYQTLVPAEGMPLLQYLRNKNLFQLLRHEILFQDKKLKASRSNAESFYLSCFHYFIDFPYKYYDKKITEAFAEKYLKAKEHLTESDHLYVKYHKLFAEINRMSARKNPKKVLGITIKDLLRSEEELEPTEHFLAKYYLYRSICSYYTYYEKDNGKNIEYLQKAIRLKSKIAYFFPIDIGQFLDLLYADALFQNNRIAEAEMIYKNTFDQGLSKEMYGYYYHCEQFILVSIIRKNHSKALALLDSVFQPCINNKLDIFATRGAMSYVKLYLSNGDLKNASAYLNIAKAINEKSFYLPFDIQLRVLENFYFVQKKDHDFAIQLANRNLKFLRSQEHPELFKDYMLLWKMMAALLGSLEDPNDSNEDILKDHKYLSARYANLYCNLIADLPELAKISA